MSRNWDTILFEACSTGNKDSATLAANVIEASEWDPDKRYKWNIGLYQACLKGHKELVELMLEKGANNLAEGLATACGRGYKEIVELMIEKGAGANTWDWGLAEAFYGDYKDIVFLLLRKGAILTENNLKLLTDIDLEYLIKEGIINSLPSARITDISIILQVIKTNLSCNLPNDLASLCYVY